MGHKLARWWIRGGGSIWTHYQKGTFRKEFVAETLVREKVLQKNPIKEKKMKIEGTKRHLQKSQNKDKVLISIRNKLEKVKSELVFLRDNM